MTNGRGAGFARPDVVCLGILVADVIARPVDALGEPGSLRLVDTVELHGGGCALNTASALVPLGLRAAVAGKVGRDPFGDFLLRLLDERGVDRRAVVQDRRAPTSASIVLVAERGERSFLHVPGADDAFGAGDVDRTIAFSGRALHFAGIGLLAGLAGEPLAELAAAAQARGIRTSLDTVWDARARWHDLDPLLPHLDLAVPSLSEAQALSGESSPEGAAAWLRGRGVRSVAITLGPDGCYGDGDDFTGYVRPPRVAAVDETGAGDAFAAGVLHGVLAGRPFVRALELGCAAGALATTAIGAFAGVGDRSAVEALSASCAARPRSGSARRDRPSGARRSSART